MFDPFKDFATAGYLRNVEGLSDLEEVKLQEHVFFEANLDSALHFLRRRRVAITYEDFLEVHRILFGEFYPWVGRDRHQLGVARIVGKGADIQFEVSELCRQAVEWGLRLANDPKHLRQHPGEVMGAFAWAHPFLDGNGRTMLLVHNELCHRAAFAIDWTASNKDDYLTALTQELSNPSLRALDAYLLPLVVERKNSDDWLAELKSLPGLGGSPTELEDVVYQDTDAAALARYRELKRKRGESIP